MSYLLTRHMKRLLLVPVGVISLTGAVNSADWVTLSDGLCNYCAEHNSGNLHAKTITTSYAPLLGYTERTLSTRSATAHSKPETRSEKPLLFVDTDISVRRTESVVDLLFKNIRLANTGSTNDRLCNYCEDYLAGNVTSEQYKTSYTPLSGYGPDGSSTSSRGLPEIAAF
jgi:hypothetical protein